MKFSSLIFTLVCLVSSLSFAQGNSGGGGNALHSTPAYVRSLLSSYIDNKTGKGSLRNFYLSTTFATIQKELAQKGDALSIKDPELRDVFEKMLAKNAAIRNLQTSNIIVNEAGPCLGAEGPSDASVSANVPGADICFSIPRLRKYPPKLLNKVLNSLMVHELGHESGFKDEALLKKIQKFVYFHVNNTCKVSLYFSGTAFANPSTVWRRFNIFLKKDEGILGLGEGSGQVEYEVIHTEKAIQVTATVENTEKEYGFEINKNGASYLKFSAPNADLSKAPIEVKWMQEYAPERSDYGVLIPWQYSKKGSVHATGLYNGKPLDIDSVQVDSECFYLNDDENIID